MVAFDKVGDQFVDYYETVRGHVREVLTWHNLEPYLSALPADVIDVGGGDGRDAARFAKLGYRVTLIDPAEAMLNKAKERFEKERVKVRLLKVNPENVRLQFRGEKFDVVVSHGVLMYCQDRPEQHVQDLAVLARPEATVSLLTKGFSGALSRAVHKRQARNITELLDSGRCVNNLGLRVWAFKPEQVQTMLGNCALELLQWQGVRVGSEYDNRPVKTVSEEEIKQILTVEKAFASDRSTRGLGQMLHFIAKTASS
jgi:S-adenosylmethionine-dependent methyltransferase